jgi:hypothetical protein
MTNLTKNSDTYWPLGLPPVLGSTIPESMQALTIHRNDYGPPSQVIRMEAVPTPLLGEIDAGRVLVAILATGPNYNTNFAALGLPVPVFGRGDSASIHIPGSDALGIVVDAGSAVTRVKVGQATKPMTGLMPNSLQSMRRGPFPSRTLYIVILRRAWPLYC